MADDTQSSRSGGRLFTIFLVIAVAGLSVLVVFLARENRALKAEISRLTTSDGQSSKLGPGDRLGALPVREESGEVRTLSFDRGEPTLLLVYSHSCSICTETLPLWAEIIREHDADDLRIEAVTTDTPEGSEQAAPSPLPMSAHPVVDPVRTDLVRLSMVPAAILLGPEGRIHRMWVGASDEASLAELRSAVADPMGSLRAGSQ